ncbi:MAG: hypothetical protein IKN26_08240 [Eubacterium sp.]|nr:hypothetical protein [Eubacterium sp.]MBR7060603.1 hypothetical protein [Eubacterium sp.]
MKNEYWQKFLQTGKAEDYINYVNDYYNSVNSAKVENEVNNEGLDNKGTDYRGE